LKEHDHKNIINGEYDYYDEKNKHNDEDHFHAIYVSLLIMAGFLFFFITEKLATYHMSFNDDENNEKIEKNEKSKKNDEKLNENLLVSEKSVETKLRKRNLTKNQKFNNETVNERIDETVGTKIQNSNFYFNFLNVFNKLSASGWLNLLADSMHNFTDGIAIGNTLFYIYVCRHVYI
jgi:zinc transporter ZupT